MGVIQCGEVVERGDDVGMVGTQRLFTDGERAFEERLGEVPLTKCSRRIRPIVSTVIIPGSATSVATEGSTMALAGVVNFWTPIRPQAGQLFHADLHSKPEMTCP